MEHRQFGNSDLYASAIGFGTWEMSARQYGHIDAGEATRAVQSAIDQGITLFDTSETYGPYHSERLLGRALGARRKDVILVTKVGFTFQDDPEHPGQLKIDRRDSSASNIIERAEGCLRRLGTDVIDLLLIHFHDHKTAHEDTMAGLQQLKAAGKIHHYGVSNYSAPMMAACQKQGQLTANQVGYHLFDRRVENAVLPYCRAQGIGFMAYGTLAFGLLSGAFSPETSFVDWDWRSRGDAFGLPLFQRERFLKQLRAVERLKALAADYGKSVAQLAIAWLLGRPGVTVALVGMRNERELKENVAAADWRLSEDDCAAIDRIFAEEGIPTYMEVELVT